MRLGAGDVFAIGGEGGDEGECLIRIEIAGDDDVCPVRGVAVAVVIGEIRVRDFIEKVAVADDRLAAGIHGEGCGKQ